MSKIPSQNRLFHYMKPAFHAAWYVHLAFVLLYIPVNFFLSYFVTFGSGSHPYVRGYVSVKENYWRTIPVKKIANGTQPTFLLYKAAFVRLRFDSWKAALDPRVILYVLMSHAAMLLGLGITYQLRKISISMADKSIFSSAIIRRLRIIAIFILFIPCCQFAAGKLFGNFVAGQIRLPGHDIYSYGGFNFELMFLSLLVWILIEIFRFGLHLQKENDLTV